MSQPPGPPNPYGDQPQQPYGQNPYAEGAQGAPGGIPQQQPYGQPGGYPGYPQQGYPAAQQYGYPPSNLPPGMPPLASWGARLGATLLDGLMLMLVPTGLTTAGYISFGKKVVDAQKPCRDAGIAVSHCPTPTMSGGTVTLIALGSLLSLAAFIFLCFREGSTGQTPGKKIVGIRLLREQDGSALGFGLAFGRRLLHVLDSFCLLGYLWPLWDEKKQTFADKLVHTVVIRDEQ
ncbi:RDD family protein [Streptomyces sp. NPDC051976]|uniref:RDD family protein n=1 Tax=Streptomyces sp. NPDC051976 TaxID=3154947 RepID=UPI0034401647